MAPFYQKPENAVKRAEELISVSQHAAALSMLHEVVLSKRARTSALQVLEPIVLKCIELAVSLGKSRVARDVLYQLKNIIQNTTIVPIEAAIKRLLELAEERLTAAQSKAEKIVLDSVDDLDAIETPESILLSAVSTLVSKDRTDRAIVTPWLRFLWEAHRTALDVVRNNSRLEHIYQFVAAQALAFCTKYARKVEFRKLCDTLRFHLAAASKPPGHQPFPISLDDPDTLHRHLSVRFIQLNAAAELELWQEGFRTIEDIHSLIQVSKKQPKPYMMAIYYERLARIFLVGENYLFHAAAMNKYYSIMRQNKDLSQEEHERISSLVLLSAMAVPIISSSDYRSFETEESKTRSQRLTALLHFQQVPTRESLIREALGVSVFQVALPKIRELYKLLEVDFHPLSITKSVVPIITSFNENAELERYTKRLHDAVLTRLIKQLSQVYTTVKIAFVTKLAAFPEPHAMTDYDIEKFVMNGSKRGEFLVRIDHRIKSLVFTPDVLAGVTVAADGNMLGVSTLDAEVDSATGVSGIRPKQPVDVMRFQLARLARCLHSVLPLISPKSVQGIAEAKRKAFIAAAEHMEEERRATMMRRALIEKKKEIREHQAIEKDREEQRLRLERLQSEQAAEKLRLEEEARRREIERVEQQRSMIDKHESVRLAGLLADQLREKNVGFNKSQLDNMDKKSLIQLQIEQLEKERRDLSTKIKTLSKRTDHLERAFRKEEIPLLHKDFEEQQVRDRQAFVEGHAARLQKARETHKSDMVIKARFLRMLDDYHELRLSMQKRHEDEYAAQRAKADRQIAAAKEARLKEAREQFEADKLRRAQEAADRVRRAKEERERRKREAIEAEERMREQEARRAEEAERIRKADEVARRQRERELEVERRKQQERDEAESERRTRSSMAPAAPTAGGGFAARAPSFGQQPLAASAAPAKDLFAGNWRNKPKPSELAPSAPSAPSSTPSPAPSSAPGGASKAYVTLSRRSAAPAAGDSRPTPPPMFDSRPPAPRRTDSRAPLFPTSSNRPTPYGDSSRDITITRRAAPVAPAAPAAAPSTGKWVAHGQSGNPSSQQRQPTPPPPQQPPQPKQVSEDSPNADADDGFKPVVRRR